MKDKNKRRIWNGLIEASKRVAKKWWIWPVAIGSAMGVATRVIFLMTCPPGSVWEEIAVMYVIYVFVAWTTWMVIFGPYALYLHMTSRS
jgi:hypothetical protein